MDQPLLPLILDLLEWLEREPRSYADVMDAWRTSCPRLTVWEDAMEKGCIRRSYGATGVMIEATEEGRALLHRHRQMHMPHASQAPHSAASA